MICFCFKLLFYKTVILTIHIKDKLYRHRRYSVFDIVFKAKYCLFTRPWLRVRASKRKIEKEWRERERGDGTSTEMRRRRGKVKWGKLCRACGAPDKKRWAAVGARRGAKTRDEAQSPGAAGPSFERLSFFLSLFLSYRSVRALDMCTPATYALSGFSECIDEYRAHYDKKGDSAVIRTVDWKDPHLSPNIELNII